MNLEKRLDYLHSAVTGNRLMQLFTAFTRVLIAIGFIPPSIPKILHRPFTMLGVDNPVGAYFDALYRTGFYYEFIGWSQLAAAILLLIPRTSHIGAFLFLPIIVNIAVLTNSVYFKGTWMITILMTLAALYLAAWEFDRVKPIFFRSRTEKPRIFPMQFILIPLFFAFGGLVLTGAASLINIGNLTGYGLMAAAASIAGLVFGFAVAFHFWFMRVGQID